MGAHDPARTEGVGPWGILCASWGCVDPFMCCQRKGLASAKGKAGALCFTKPRQKTRGGWSKGEGVGAGPHPLFYTRKNTVYISRAQDLQLQSALRHGCASALALPAATAQACAPACPLRVQSGQCWALLLMSCMLDICAASGGRQGKVRVEASSNSAEAAARHPRQQPQAGRPRT